MAIEIPKMITADEFIGFITNNGQNIALQEGTVINGDIDLSSRNKNLPKDLKFDKLELPKNLTINGSLNLSGNYLNGLPKHQTLYSLPDNLTINGDLDLQYSLFPCLPNNLYIKGNLNLDKSTIEFFTEKIQIDGVISISKNHTIIDNMSEENYHKYFKYITEDCGWMPIQIINDNGQCINKSKRVAHESYEIVYEGPLDDKTIDRILYGDFSDCIERVHPETGMAEIRRYNSPTSYSYQNIYTLIPKIITADEFIGFIMNNGQNIALQEGTVINGDINLSVNSFLSKDIDLKNFKWPKNLIINGNLNLSGLLDDFPTLSHLSDNLTVNGYLDLRFTNLSSLPNNLYVKESLYLERCNIDSFVGKIQVDGAIVTDDHSYVKMISKENYTLCSRFGFLKSNYQHIIADRVMPEQIIQEEKSLKNTNTLNNKIMEKNYVGTAYHSIKDVPVSNDHGVATETKQVEFFSLSFDVVKLQNAKTVGKKEEIIVAVETRLNPQEAHPTHNLYLVEGIDNNPHKVLQMYLTKKDLLAAPVQIIPGADGKQYDQIKVFARQKPDEHVSNDLAGYSVAFFETEKDKYVNVGRGYDKTTKFGETMMVGTGKVDTITHAGDTFTVTRISVSPERLAKVHINEYNDAALVVIPYTNAKGENAVLLREQFAGEKPEMTITLKMDPKTGKIDKYPATRLAEDGNYYLTIAGKKNIGSDKANLVVYETPIHHEGQAVAKNYVGSGWDWPEHHKNKNEQQLRDTQLEKKNSKVTKTAGVTVVANETQRQLKSVESPTEQQEHSIKKKM